MTAPKRIRFNRFEGLPLPAGARSVIRGTRFGNPFKAEGRSAEANAGVKARDTDIRKALEDLIVKDHMAPHEGPRGSKGYRVTASQEHLAGLRPATASATASPKEGGRGTQSVTASRTQWDAVGTQSTDLTETSS